MLKLENDVRDDAAAGRQRRLYIKAVCQLAVKAITASGVEQCSLPDWQTPLNGIISPQREADHYAKSNWKELLQKYINE